jgi:uncharacterized phiE125 gp8 family phage protein
MMWWSGHTVTGSTPSAWDYGVRWHLEQVTAPDIVGSDTLAIEDVRDNHLRGANGTTEDAYIQRLMGASYRAAERGTWRALLPQTWDLVLDRFPAGLDGRIEFPLPPLQSVVSLAYTDSAGDAQELAVSPEEFQIVAPSGPKAAKGYILPLSSGSWPSIASIAEAVRVRFTAGYPLVDGVAEIPEDIDQGRLLYIGELYKQRSESARENSPALIRAKDIWLEYRAW